MGRKTIAAAGLIALGAALSGCGEQIPPHDVRIEYLKRELYPSGSINFMGLGYFNLTNISMVDGWDLSATYTKPGLTSLRLIGGLDRDGTDNYAFDELLVVELTLDGKRGCELERSDLPEESREKVDEQYERTTQSGYIARAYNRKAFTGILGKVDFEELIGLCSADDEIPAYALDLIPEHEDIKPDLLEVLEDGEREVPPHLERIEYLEHHLTAKMIDVNSNFFRDAIFVYDDGSGMADEASPETRRGTLYTMLQRSNGEKPLDYYLLSVRDTELHGNDGDVDQVVLIRYNGKTGEEWVCKLWRHDVPDEGLLKTLDEHYELSTEAVYLALTEGKESYETVVGEDEWEQLSEFCGHSE